MGLKTLAGASDTDLRPTTSLYLSVGLIAGAVIALQICIMRVFAVGSWAHFGSLVVSRASAAIVAESTPDRRDSQQPDI